LTVLNEDHLAPGKGFSNHPHAEVELLTYVVEGALAYQDSLGTDLILEAGDCQRTSCGTGIEHSVFNHLPDRPLVVLQCWITPEVPELTPSVEHWEADEGFRRGRWALVASPQGREGSMLIHQDVDVLTTCLELGQQLEYHLHPRHHAWLQVTQGALVVNGRPVSQGDGLAISQEPLVLLHGGGDCEVLLFDMG
jgi:redox-sensitive bicupin YhaK (pirin superfamily)